MGENYVDLSQCTKKYRNNKEEIDWVNSIGAIIYFSYHNNEGNFKIIDYIKDKSLVKIEYNQKTYSLYTSVIKNCKLGSLFKKTYLYNIGEIINDKKILDRMIIERKDKNGWKIHYRYYKIYCLKCNKESITREDNIKKCEKCVHCVFNKPLLCNERPDLKEYFQEKDLEHFYTKTLGSGTKLFFVCPKCHRIKNVSMSIIDLTNGKFACTYCSDGYSMGEKYISSLLTQLNIQYDYQYSFKDNSIKFTEMSYTPVYDFVIHDLKLIIEIDGIQHQEGRKHFKNRFNLTQQELDILKNKFAQQLEYNVVRLNYLSYEYKSFEKEIIEKLSSFFIISKVDFELCKKESLKSYIHIAAELWNGGLSVRKIADKIKLHPNTIGEYLKVAADLNLCDYTYAESRRRGNVQGMVKRKKIICIETGELFNSVRECSLKSENIFGVYISKPCLYQQLEGKNKSAKGYHFKYYEDAA